MCYVIVVHMHYTLLYHVNNSLAVINCTRLITVDTLLKCLNKL